MKDEPVKSDDMYKGFAVVMSIALAIFVGFLGIALWLMEASA